jgi:branched-chain amino acid transport system ATP-binding protein
VPHGDDGRLCTVGITVEFEGVRALDAVDLELAPGEILGLIGPNGAGKTTLVNVMTGFQPPTLGSVRLGSVDLTRLAPHRLVRAGVARSFQGGRPFSGLTVFESIEVAALGSGKPRTEARELARSLLDRIGLAEKAGARAASLPYGDQRRVGVVRALATGPAFLLLDEPAAGLNEAEADELVTAIRRIRDDFACGVLLIEHDMRVVMGLCERIHALDHGQTIAVGSPAEIRRDARVIEAYLGSRRQ